MGVTDKRLVNVEPLWSTEIRELETQLAPDVRVVHSLRVAVLHGEDIPGSAKPIPESLYLTFPLHPLSSAVRPLNFSCAELGPAIFTAWTVPGWAVRVLTENNFHMSGLPFAWWCTLVIARTDDPAGTAGMLLTAMSLGASTKEACECAGFEHYPTMYPFPPKARFQTMINWFYMCSRNPSIAHTLPIP
jgi:hypothetical protein